MEITGLLRRVQAGDARARNELFEVVYGQLRHMARRQRRRFTPSDTLGTTALAHEAYLKLVRREGAGYADRVHFFAVAATAMRHVLADYAERQRAAKRGGDTPDLSIDHDLRQEPIAPETAADVLALHQALERLEVENPRRVRVVECRFFAGLTVEETATALGVSAGTVRREWALARHALSEVLCGEG